MKIVANAFAGTLESSDVLVRVGPSEQLEVTVNSSVMAQYGEEITAVVNETLEKMDVRDGAVFVEDKGALDFVIRARVQAAVLRGAKEQPDWSRL